MAANESPSAPLGFGKRGMGTRREAANEEDRSSGRGHLAI
jgi:hypothetical protein